MIYLLALIGAVTVAAMIWAATGPKRNVRPRPRVLAPDDDPDFLRRLSERRKED